MSISGSNILDINSCQFSVTGGTNLKGLQFEYERKCCNIYIILRRY